MKHLFHKTALLKNFIARANTWLGMVNSVLIILTFKRVYELSIPAWLIITIGVVVFLIIGILDFYLVMPYQILHQNTQNDMKKDLVQLRRMIEDGKLGYKENKDADILGANKVPITREQKA